MKTRSIVLLAVALVLATGLAIPERAAIPVAGASASDWNSQSFWHEPWGTSGVHKGIDIFSPEATPVLSAVPGIVIYKGTLGKGGNVIAVLGPRWRIHYYAHLSSADVAGLFFVARGQQIGSVGTTGNAAGKPPYLHYTVLSLVPLPWRATSGTQGWKRMFFLDPGEMLQGA